MGENASRIRTGVFASMCNCALKLLRHAGHHNTREVPDHGLAAFGSRADLPHQESKGSRLSIE